MPSAFNQKNRPDSLVSLQGVIIPVKWDPDGRVAAIAIATTDERQLIVDEQSGTGKELRHLLQAAVRLKGRISLSLRSDSRSEQIIEVQDYKPIKAGKPRVGKNS
jgi:hypothetical protein